MSSQQIAELIDLAHTQLLHTGNWSLTTNPASLGALATDRELGFDVVGRRGRFERHAVPR
jgi:hypothetical protein